MDITLRRNAFALLQAVVLTAAAASSPLGESKPFADASDAMPISESQPGIETDTQTAASPLTVPSDLGMVARTQSMVAQTFETTTEPGRAVTPGRSGNENATVSALRALSEQVKSLESRIAAQDARIALLERSLDDLQRRSNR